jgi:hypothetical protein
LERLSGVERATVVCFDRRTLSVYQTALQELPT